MVHETGNCFLATARGLGFETSVLEPCVLVLRSLQQGYHGIIGVATLLVVQSKSGNRLSRCFLKRFIFGHSEVRKGKYCFRGLMQAADGSMRVRQPADIESLDFVPL